MDKGDVMDYEYQITEGGIYTVKAFAPDDVAEATSNEVEVSQMKYTVGVQPLSIATAPSTITPVQFKGQPMLSGTFTIAITDPIPGIDVYFATTNLTGISASSAVSDRKAFKLVTTSAEVIRDTFLYFLGSLPLDAFMYVMGDSDELVGTIKGAIGTTFHLYTKDPEGNLVSVASRNITEVQKCEYPAMLYSLTDYKNELKITSSPECILSTLFSNINITFSGADGLYSIVGTNALAPTYTDTEFASHIPKEATQVKFSLVPVSTFAGFLGDPPSSEVTVNVKRLEAPVLTYSATEGKLHWDEVEGADRYEVWKDGVKIADIPKKT